MLFREKSDVEYIRQHADEIHAEMFKSREAESSRDVYAIAFFLGRNLRSRFKDIQIMVGDRDGVMHHWLEIPSRGLYIDAAKNPVRIGYTYQEGFQRFYTNGRVAKFNFDEPRDWPEYVFAPEKPESPYRD